MCRRPVYTWAMRSSQPRGGQLITYETRLNDDGSLSCNCPGWVFSRKSPKECKHTRHVGTVFDPEDILKRWRRGERLELLDEDNNQITGIVAGLREVPTTEQPVNDNTGLKYGRLVEFD